MDAPLVAIVENDPVIIGLMCEVLNDAGYRTVTGTNADDVESILFRERPDLLILDVRLPGGVTGLPLLSTLRDNPATARLPIIVTTADASFLRKNAWAVHGLGCETLEKPFDLDSLLGCVASFLPVGKREVS